MSRLKAWAAIIFGTFYLLNLGVGFFEFIPDQFPIIGNLDEGGATFLILWGIKTLKSFKKLSPPHE